MALGTCIWPEGGVDRCFADGGGFTTGIRSRPEG